MISFVLGAVTSMVCGYIGMYVAVFSNARTTVNCCKPGYKEGFNTAFRAGAVMGFALTGLGILVMYATMCGFSTIYDQEHWSVMFDCLSGYGLGGSSIAMFGRVGGGIYTKAADVGADLVGKVIEDLPEDSPRNPATIADNVGDNVGDVAGMGADLFGSFAESTCAALVIASGCPDLRAAGWGALCFPLVVSCAGILVCLVTSFVATHLFPVNSEAMIEKALRMQLIVSTVLMVPAAMLVGGMYVSLSLPLCVYAPLSVCVSVTRTNPPASPPHTQVPARDLGHGRNRQDGHIHTRRRCHVRLRGRRGRLNHRAGH